MTAVSKCIVTDYRHQPPTQSQHPISELLRTPVSKTHALVKLSLSLIALATLGTIGAQAQESPVQLIRYHGWNDCLILRNSKVEVVIVPAVGRVMQFRFAGHDDGPFWENRALDGRMPDPKAKEWGNFGGDKTWPSPQGDWQKVTDREWPPPAAFDSMSVKAADVSSGSEGPSVRLESSMDPFYGIRTTRLITLPANEPVMKIRTTYLKVDGDPRKVGIWTITQLKDPVSVFAPIPRKSMYKDGYNKQSDALPLGLIVSGNMLSLRRDPSKSTKIGNDADALVWIGEKEALKIESPRIANAEYPDQGSSAEVYTNPDPLPYVELELLGPLHTMKVGDQIEQTMTYTLFQRREAEPAAEAQRALGK
jgi:hypothetical protein